MREELPIPAAITSGVAAISLQTAAPTVSTATAPMVCSFVSKALLPFHLTGIKVSPSVIKSNDLLTTAPPPVFSIPPPVIAPQTPQPVVRFFALIFYQLLLYPRVFLIVLLREWSPK